MSICFLVLKDPKIMNGKYSKWLMEDEAGPENIFHFLVKFLSEALPINIMILLTSVVI